MVSKVLKILSIFFWIFCGTLSYSMFHENERVIVFDVGQGDSILIQKGDFEILIDGGEDNTLLYKLGKYMNWNDRVVDIVVITHMHADHYMGIKYLMERYEVGLFVLSANCTDLCAYFRNYNHIDVRMGDILVYKDIELQILWPQEGYFDRNINNDSIVILLEWLEKRLLFTGDAEVEVEHLLLEYYGEKFLSNIDVLKAGHHCSRTASSYGFITTTTPNIIICSCGENNRFGHPHKEVIDLFETLNLEYILTWEYGDFIVE